MVRNKYFILIFVFVIWTFFFDPSSVVKCSRIKLNIREQELLKEHYRKEIKMLEEKLNELNSNRDSLEKFAREQYLFKKEDEDIFIIEVPK